MLRSLGPLVALLALALGACASADAPPGGDGETAEGAAAGAPLTPRHRASQPEVANGETRTASGDIAAALGEPIRAGGAFTVLRELDFDGTRSLLVADAETFRTRVVPKDSALAASAAVDPGSITRLLDAQRANDATEKTLARDGLPDGTMRVALTIDMCQSSKPWEKRLFDWLVTASKTAGAPMTVGIAMTGGWAKAHAAQLGELLDLAGQGQLDIVWVNHSLTHPLHCRGAGQTDCAFLTDPSVDFTSEVLGNEALLLSQGALPSALFRFPGLVHDHERRSELLDMKLFALDADAWLAKGQPMRDGAVVLVHGNGNEPAGVTTLLNIVDTPVWLDGLRAGKNRLVSPLLAIGPTGR